MTSGLWRYSWIVRPAGSVRPPSGPSGAVIDEERLQDRVRRRVVVGQVLERPLELAGDRADFRSAVAPTTTSTLLRVCHEIDEQEGDDDRRDDRPDDLGDGVAVGLRRQLVVARLAPVADDRPDDQAFDDEEDDDRDQEHDRVELADLGALRRSRPPAGRSSG